MKLLIIALFIILITAVSGCCKSGSIVCDCDTTHLSYNDSLMNTFKADTAFAERLLKTYHLKPLSDEKHERYRLQMGHSFSRFEQFYTLSRTNSGGLLEVRQYYSARKSGKTVLDTNYTATLTKTQWKNIKNAIDSSCYWTNEIGKDLCKSCLDGGSWSLEAFDPAKGNCAKRDHHIDVCSFGSTGKLGKLCLFIRKYVDESQLDVYKD